jgi:hypothetical protein
MHTGGSTASIKRSSDILVPMLCVGIEDLLFLIQKYRLLAVANDAHHE